MHRHLIRRDVICFIDNEAATAFAIRGSSSEPGADTMVQVAHLLWLGLECRNWIEWIDSRFNLADGLSRRGLLDEWTWSQGWRLPECQHPPWDGNTNAPDRLFHALWKDIGLCGGGDIGLVRLVPHGDNMVCILRKTNVRHKVSLKGEK